MYLYLINYTILHYNLISKFNFSFLIIFYSCFKPIFRFEWYNCVQDDYKSRTSCTQVLGELPLSTEEALKKALEILNSVDNIKAEICKMYGAPDNDQYFIRLKGYEIKNDTGS